MQPILMKFKGFYNYIEEEEIDFTVLNDGRLFGIFGKTGSGKSAILDAISFAFFGKIDRHLDNETKAFINIYTKEGFVDFTFKVQKRGYGKEYETYRVVRKFAITEKKSKEVDSEVLVYDEFGNVLSTKIKESNLLLSEILNIKEEDFSKIICLPQGKFNKFLHDSPSNRTNFLLKIFNIEKYEVKDEMKNKINNLKNELELIEKEIITTLSFGFSEEEDIKIEKYNDHILELEKRYKELSNSVFEMEEKSKTLKSEHSLLEKEKTSQEEKLKAFKEIKSLKANYKALNEELEKEKVNYELAVFSQKVNYILPSYNNYKKCKSIIEKTVDELKKLKENVMKISKELEEYKDFETNKKVVEKHIQNLLIDKEKLDQLMEEEKKENYQTSLKCENEKIEEQIKVLKKANNDYKMILDEKQKVFDEIEHIKKNLVINEKNQKLLEDRETLGAFLIKLEEDGICPLCGSENHPKKVEIALEKEFKKNKEEKIELLNKRVTKEKGLIDFIKAIRTTDIIYNQDSFETQVTDKINAFYQKIMEKERDVEKLENLYKLKREKYDAFLKRASEIAGDVPLNEFCKTLSVKLKNLVDKLEEDSLKYKKASEDFVKNSESISNKEEFLKLQKEEFIMYQKEYENLIEKYDFKNFEVEKDRAISFEKVELIFKNFEKLKEETSKANTLLLEKEKITLNFNYEELERENFITISNLKAKDELIGRFASEKGGLQEKIKKIDDIFLKLKDKKENHNDIKNQLLDYQTLEKIVGKKKLVNYIINLKMNRLIENANLHLSKITRDKYQLICSSNLEFLVYERHLNKTFTRNIKSLSGGETFIFSLCLSLALSKELQKSSLNKFEFFFIDEGFGTLDEEKLQKIYETLSILSEDMTIGFITHIPFMKNFVQHKILVGENINGEEILDGKKISVV